MSDATPAPETEEATPKVAVDHEANLSTAFVAASQAFTTENGLDEAATATLQEAFRSVPSAARGKAQGTALKAVIVSGNPAAVEAILDACNNLPKATASRTSTPVDPKVALAIQAAGLLVAFADVTSDPEIGEEVATLAKGWYTDGAPDDKKDAILRSAASAVKSSSRRGGGGSRKTFTEQLTDLIARGDIKTPQTLTCSVDGVTARVMKSGEVKVGDDSFDNLSAAAKHVKGEGKSVNGWDFWQVDGKSIGELRQG